MRRDKIYPEILSSFLITQITDEVARQLCLAPDTKSAAIITANIDDFIFLALDEATKKADIRADFAASFYGGNPNASSKLQGEGIGIISGTTVSEVKAGLEVIHDMEKNKLIYAVSCNEDDSIAYLTFTVAKIGTYFAKDLSLDVGTSIAYLVGPPVESIYGADEAIKTSGAELVKLYKAPEVETNNGGAILTGSQSECMAACDAFGRAVQYVADNPIYMGR